jgi:DNA-directed RNA polymerase subunit L
MSNQPKLMNVEETNDVLKFTLSNTNISIANGIRRVLLSEIPIVVFKTTPYTENRVLINVNKSRLNNELIKQRVSCIPIHITNVYDFPYQNYLVELDIINDTNANIYATTGDFKVKNTETNNYLAREEVKKLFPPDPITGDYINIVRLRPRLTDTSDREQIKFEATLKIGTAGEDSTFNVVSTCAYGNTLDPVKIKDGWEAKESTLKARSATSEEIEFAKKDWMLLDAKRLFKSDSYDFVVETVGIYTNFELMDSATGILIQKLYTTLQSLKNETDLINDAIDTLENSYIIVLKNEDYTVGKIIEYMLYSKYFQERKELTYAGFLKKHPHDKDSFIKIGAKKTLSKDEIISVIEDCVNSSIELILVIKKYFASV